MLSRTALRALHLRSALPRPSPRSSPVIRAPARRSLHATAVRSGAYGKSSEAGDESALDTAYNPSTTRPEKELAEADEESGEDPNPLEITGGNQDISKMKKEETTATASSKSESDQDSGRKQSGAGSPPKHGGGKHGGGY